MAGGATLLCALLLLVYTGSGVAAIRVESNSSTTYQAGENITLSISYNYIQGVFVNWYKDGVLVVTWSRESGQDGNYQGRLQVIGNGSISIADSTREDSGNYTVRVEAIGQTAGVKTFPVKVYDAVIVTEISQSPISVSEGAPLVNLTCNASSGAMTYTWTKDGDLLPTNGSFVLLDDGQTLQITLPNRAHSGNYTCNASNPVDWETATLMLDVTYSQSLSGGAIAGIVVGSVGGAILFAALIIILLFCLWKRSEEQGKNQTNTHQEAIRTISGTTLSPDDPAYFTLNNIMYRSSSISMGSYIMNNGDDVYDYSRNPSPIPPPYQTKVKKATQV